MSLCRGLQNATRLQLGVIRHPIFGRAQQARQLSSFPLASTTVVIGLLPSDQFRSSHKHRPQIITRPPCGIASSCRSYWWSSKSPTTVSTSTFVAEDDKNVIQKSQENNSPNQHSSETSSEESTSAVGGDESPFIVNNEVSMVPDSISVPPPPLQLGDLRELGFSNMTPVGAVQAALEFVQVTTGLPWWGAIILATALVRLALLHFAIKQVRTTAAMAPVRPQMDALMSELKEAKLQGDNTRAQVAVLKVRKLQRETGTGLGAVMGGPLIQASASIVMFLAIKKLCDFPLAQLKYEGVAWLPSLAAADPYYILPALSVGLMNLQIHLGRVDMAAAGKASLHFINVLPIISIASFAILSYLPGGLLIYLVSNIALVCVQGIFLRNTAVRRSLKLPPLVRPNTDQFPTMRDTWVAIKTWFANQERQAVAQAKRKAHIPVFPPRSISPAPIQRTLLQRNTRQGDRRKKA